MFVSGADVAWLTDEVGEDAARPLYVQSEQPSNGGALVGIAGSVALASIALRLPKLRLRRRIRRPGPGARGGDDGDPATHPGRRGEAPTPTRVTLRDATHRSARITCSCF